MAALISLLLRDMALAQGRQMILAAFLSWGRGIDRETDGSFEVVCLFSLLGLTLSLAFAGLGAG